MFQTDISCLFVLKLSAQVDQNSLNVYYTKLMTSHIFLMLVQMQMTTQGLPRWRFPHSQGVIRPITEAGLVGKGKRGPWFKVDIPPLLGSA